MTPSQRSRFFGTLWPDACQTQGWNPKDDERRRDVIHAATGRESASGLTNKQITLLFNKVKWLADPQNYDKAYWDANPDLALEEHTRSNIIWRIVHESAKAGLNEAWISETAGPKCKEHHAKTWRDLPTCELVKLSMTVESRTSEAANTRRQSKSAAKAVQPQCIAEDPEPDPF